MQEPVGVINMVEVWPDLGAEPTFGDGIIRVAVEADGAAVLNFRDNATGIGAVVWTGAADVQGCRHGKRYSMSQENPKAILPDRSFAANAYPAVRSFPSVFQA
jgi:hypothetical protein